MRINQFVRDQEEYENSPENSGDSPPSSKRTCASSPRRRIGMQKRVVSVPIKDVKGEIMTTPPSDSWAWRKYGQKPIKGSPYPRGYYRCSSLKGCPARKQVERSQADPTMLMVTYSFEHNHPCPASKNNHNRTRNQKHNHNQNPRATVTTSNSDDDRISTNFVMDQEFSNIDASFNNEFAWFKNLETTSVLETPILATDGIGDADIATIFSTKEEDESLFADLEELPECSLVFRRGVIVDRRPCSFTPLCRTTAGN